MRQAGELKLTHAQTAVMLGVSRPTLELFWAEHPEFREEFERGKEIRAIKLKAIGDRHATLDPPTWRFLAKNELGLSDDPSKTVLQQEAAKAIASGPDETRAKIMEITGKLIASDKRPPPSPAPLPKQRFVSRQTKGTDGTRR
jgi:hypothetical protein